MQTRSALGEEAAHRGVWRGRLEQLQFPRTVADENQLHALFRIGLARGTRLSGDEFEGKIKVVKVDVDANQQTAMRFNIRSIPSILFFKDGKHVDTVVGAVPKSLLDRKIQEHLK